MHSVFLKKKITIFDLLKIPFYYSPKVSILKATFAFFNGFVPLILMLATSNFINSIVAVSKDNSNFKTIIFSFAFLILCSIYQAFYNIICEYFEVKLKNKLRETFSVDIIQRISCVKYKYFESEKFQDLISRISNDPEDYCAEVYNNFLNAMALLIKVLGIMLILFVRVPKATLIIFFVSLPTFFVANKAGKENYKAKIDSEKYIRKVNYLFDVLIGKSTAKERNIFQYSESINEDWGEAYRYSRIIKLKAGVKWFFGSILSGSMTSIFIGLVIIMLIHPLKNGELSLGIFVAVVGNITTLIPTLAWELPEYTKAFSYAKSYTKDLSELLYVEKSEENISLPSKTHININSIEFKNVSFKYPGMKDYIIKNLSLKMKKGYHYAFVGKNGSGKSTITKLLVGLYDEFEGDILINGISIRNYKSDDLKSIFSIVHQEFSKYGISFRDNIEIGNINSLHTDYNFNKLSVILDEIGLNEVIAKLPYGLETFLGKIKQGSLELSEGQWQKVAIARAMMSEAELRILDEPTSAIDPKGETVLYELFRKFNKGKTTIFISHRLASTLFADKIFVIDDGTLAEEGNFEDLMANNSLYSTMYNKQKSWYEDI